MRVSLVSLFCFVLICFGGLFFRWARSQADRPERVQYVTFRGDPDEATRIQMTFSRPSLNLSDIPETKVATGMVADELVAFSGKLEVQKNEVLAPLLASFVEQTKKGEVTAQSTVLVPPYDPNNLEILINAPKKPGKYSLRIEWCGGGNCISRAEVVVHPKTLSKN